MENNESFEKLEFVDSAEELQASLDADANGTTEPAAPITNPEPTPEPAIGQTQEFNAEPAPEPVGESEAQPVGDSTETPPYTESEIEGAVMEFLSERLGRDITSFDELNIPQETRQIDERVQAIAEFVENTGRSPRDWFAYQQLNPSEMDDATAIRVQLASEYPTLSSEEIGMLVNDKYKLDTSLYSEDEVKLSQLQLKIDATKAKQQIEDLRNQYTAPETSAASSRSYVSEDWVNNSYREIDDLEGLQFDLGNGNTFQFGLDDSYRNQLKDKTSRLDSYFDSFVNQDGSYNYDALHTQLAIADNIDAIVSAAYNQGRGDGQRGLVDKVANVDVNTARNNGEQPVNSVAEQLKNIVGGGMTTFKI